MKVSLAKKVLKRKSGVRSSLHIIRLDFTCLRVSEMIFRNSETSKFWPDFLPAANFGKLKRHSNSMLPGIGPNISYNRKKNLTSSFEVSKNRHL